MSKSQWPSRSTMLMLAVFLLPLWWAAVIAAPIFIHANGLLDITAGLTEALKNPFVLQWTDITLRFLIGVTLAYVLGVAMYYMTRHNTRPGEEHGSAVWGDARQICAKYRAPKHDENVILTQNVRIGLDGRKHRRNLNVLVVGGSGSGKSRFYAKPSAPVRAAI